MAVARCNPTTKARYGLSLEASWRTSVAQEPPIHDGTSTVWPKLEIGNNSLTPWSKPITMACSRFMWYTAGITHVLSSVAHQTGSERDEAPLGARHQRGAYAIPLGRFQTRWVSSTDGSMCRSGCPIRLTERSLPCKHSLVNSRRAAPTRVGADAPTRGKGKNAKGRRGAGDDGCTGDDIPFYQLFDQDPAAPDLRD